jgi:hypothetical protein
LRSGQAHSQSCQLSSPVFQGNTVGDRCDRGLLTHH